MRFGRLFIERFFESVLAAIEATERRAHLQTPHNHRWALAKHKTQTKTLNTKLKSVKRGRMGGGAIFMFDDVGPRPSGLNGCAIRRSRAKAMQE